MKYYTTIEQSKKLLELGLSPESADMYYEDDISIVVGHPWHEQHIPCWSVGALLSIMPFHIIKGSQRYAFGLHKGLNKNGETFMLIYNVYNTDIVLHETEYYNSPIEAAYNMVIWLLENNYLKTESPLTPPVNK